MGSPSPTFTDKPPTNGFALHIADKTNEHIPTIPRVPPPTMEYLLATIYPLTLVLAWIFYHLSPSPAARESHFSYKGNVPNVVFVKYGWFWTTAVFGLHVSRLRASSRSKAILRWVMATVWWIIVTQWCFGLPLMDRTFLVTGGACRVRVPTGGIDVVSLYSSAACKLGGGKWSGGHDLSGHVFLLTHASMFLWSEMLPVLRASPWWELESGAVIVLLLMWWWMLLMTGLYFHTLIEQVCFPHPWREV